MLIPVAAVPNFDFLELIWFRTSESRLISTIRRYAPLPPLFLSARPPARRAAQCHVFSSAPIPIRTSLLVSLVNEKYESLKLSWLFRQSSRAPASLRRGVSN